MEEIKVGIIGCGGIGNLHAHYLKEIEGIKINAASDMNKDLLNDFCKKFNPTYSSETYQDILDPKKIDIVLVCTPTHTHYPIVMEAARRGINIFCEKPIARYLEHAEEMIEICEKNDLLFMVGFVRRFDNIWLKAKEIIESGKLGKPIVWRDIRAFSGPWPRKWFFEKDKGGGPILDAMIHNFDFGNWIFGEVKEIISGITTLKKEVSCIDTGSIWIEYTSGNFMANVWSWGVPHHTEGVIGMDMISPDGVLLFPETFNKEEFEGMYDPSIEDIFLLQTEGGKKEVIKYKKNERYKDQIMHMIECLRQNKKPIVSGREGLKALEIALKALKE